MSARIGGPGDLGPGSQRRIVLELDDVSVHFGGIKAVQNLSLSLYEGEILALIGPNGAGKTTAFNVITGVYEATHGKAKAFGQDLKGLQVHEVTNLGLARTFQNIRLFKELSVRDNILVALDRTTQNSTSRSLTPTGPLPGPPPPSHRSTMPTVVDMRSIAFMSSAVM